MQKLERKLNYDLIFLYFEPKLSDFTVGWEAMTWSGVGGGGGGGGPAMNGQWCCFCSKKVVD